MDTYGSRGLKVLAFPCNQFGGQEPVRITPITLLYCLTIFALNVSFGGDGCFSLTIVILAC